MSPLNPIFPVDMHNIQAWKGKTLDELEKIHDKLMAKMDAIDAGHAPTVFETYSHLLEQLEYVINQTRTAQDERESQADNRRRDKRKI